MSVAPASAIENPRPQDVLSGRGNYINKHPGNEYFRSLVRQYKVAYVATHKNDKPLFSRIIFDSIRSLNPPGRFLRQDEKTKVWYDIGERKALDKTRQALREGAPELVQILNTGDDVARDSVAQSRAHRVEQGFIPRQPAPPPMFVPLPILSRDVELPPSSQYPLRYRSTTACPSVGLIGESPMIPSMDVRPPRNPHHFNHELRHQGESLLCHEMQQNHHGLLYRAPTIHSYPRAEGMEESPCPPRHTRLPSFSVDSLQNETKPHRRTSSIMSFTMDDDIIVNDSSLSAIFHDSVGVSAGYQDDKDDIKPLDYRSPTSSSFTNSKLSKPVHSRNSSRSSNTTFAQAAGRIRLDSDNSMISFFGKSFGKRGRNDTIELHIDNDNDSPSNDHRRRLDTSESMISNMSPMIPIPVRSRFDTDDSISNLSFSRVFDTGIDAEK